MEAIRAVQRKSRVLQKVWTDGVGYLAEIVEGRFPGITKEHAFRLAMLTDSLLGGVRTQLSDERMRRDPDVLKGIGQVIEHIRSSFEEPPISVGSLPKEDFSVLTPEEVQRQERVVWIN